jgi:hypothetical protein
MNNRKVSFLLLIAIISVCSQNILAQEPGQLFGSNVSEYWHSKIGSAKESLRLSDEKRRAKMNFKEDEVWSQCPGEVIENDWFSKHGLEASFKYFNKIQKSLIGAVGQQDRLAGIHMGCAVPSWTSHDLVIHDSVHIKITDVAYLEYEDEIAFLIGHETSHFLLAHEWLRDDFLSDINQRIAPTNANTYNLFNPDYTAYVWNQEMDADLMSFWLLGSAKLNPRIALTGLLLLNRHNETDHPNIEESFPIVSQELKAIDNKLAINAEPIQIPAEVRTEWRNDFVEKFESKQFTESNAAKDDILHMVDKKIQETYLLFTKRPLPIGYQPEIFKSCRLKIIDPSWDPHKDTAHDLIVNLADIAIVNPRAKGKFVCFETPSETSSRHISILELVSLVNRSQN